MLAIMAMGVVAYIVGVVFLARMASGKWHPDGGETRNVASSQPRARNSLRQRAEG